MFKKILALALCGMMMFAFVSCKDEETSETYKPELATRGEEVKGAPQKPEFVSVNENGSRTDDEVGFQLEKAQKGEEIAVLKIKGFGDIRIRLFEKSAPIAVANFKGLIKSGYYDGIIFHRIIDSFMIQGGDPEGTGTGGQSVWGVDFEDEFNANLLNIRGSLSMANSGPATNGSQFFINQSKEVSFTKQELADYYDNYIAAKEQFKAQYEEAYPDMWETYFYQQSGSVPDPSKISDEAWELYGEHGGNITLDGAFSESGRGHTVFGQVFEEDMKIVDKIAAVETDDSDKPTDDVVIESAQIVKY